MARLAGRIDCHSVDGSKTVKLCLQGGNQFSKGHPCEAQKPQRFDTGVPLYKAEFAVVAEAFERQHQFIYWLSGSMMTGDTRGSATCPSRAK
jgi:hypothetical protein